MNFFLSPSETRVPQTTSLLPPPPIYYTPDYSASNQISAVVNNTITEFVAINSNHNPSKGILYNQPDAGAFVNNEIVSNQTSTTNAPPVNTQVSTLPSMSYTFDFFTNNPSPSEPNTTTSVAPNPSPSIQTSSASTIITPSLQITHPYNEIMSIQNPLPQPSYLNENTSLFVIGGAILLMIFLR